MTCCAPASRSRRSRTPTFTDIGLQPNTPYLYSVRGNGVTTPVLTVDRRPDDRYARPHTTSPLRRRPVPAAPAALHVTGSTPSTITIGWSGKAGASYDVLRSGIKIATVTSLTFTDIGLQPKTPYLYSIRGSGVTTPVLNAAIA